MPRVTYLYRPGHPKASPSGFVDSRDLGDWVERPPALAVVGDSHYDGLRATDGTPIDTRAKHRAYMKANGLTTADDFKDTWAKQEADRKRLGAPSKERREEIGRALYHAEKGGKR